MQTNDEAEIEASLVEMMYRSRNRQMSHEPSGKFIYFLFRLVLLFRVSFFYLPVRSGSDGEGSMGNNGASYNFLTFDGSRNPRSYPPKFTK